MIVRTAELKDLENVIGLFKQIDEHHRVNVPNTYKVIDKEFRVQYFRKCLDSEKIIIIVAEEDGKVVGFADAVINEIADNPMEFDKKFLRVVDIIVDKDFRRMGIANKLFTYLEEEAKRFDLDFINLGVHKFNVEAEKFYEKSGFKPYITIMRKDLK